MTHSHRWMRRWLSPLLLLLIWQIFGSQADPHLGLPTPGGVASAAGSLISSGELPVDVAMSLVRAALGYAVALRAGHRY